MIAHLSFSLGGAQQVSYLIILFEGIYSKITTVLEFSCHYFSESK